MRPVVKLAVVVPLAALALAACGSKPTSTSSGSSSSAGAKFQACMVLDTGGVDDKSFNQSSWKGMTDAKAKNANVEISYVQSQSEADYTPNLTAQVKKGCKVVIAVGGLMTEALSKLAPQYPDTHFAIVDSAVDGAKNVYGMTFKNEQSGFLAGYVAASISKTGKIGTYGGIDVGAGVTGYMDGYQQGAEYWGKQHGKTIQVLGENTFAGSFKDTPKGKSITDALVQQGADVVFPVAGGAGGGSFTSAQADGGKLSVVWVDFPGCTYYPEDCKYIPTSALKDIPANVTDYVTKAASGDYLTGTYVGDLKNKGSEIDSFNQFDSKVSAQTKSELDQIRQKIISGDITITLRKPKS